MGDYFILGKIMHLADSVWALLCIFREFEFGDHGMKHGETLGVVWDCERFTAVCGNSVVRYALSGDVKVPCVFLCSS